MATTGLSGAWANLLKPKALEEVANAGKKTKTFGLSPSTVSKMSKCEREDLRAKQAAEKAAEKAKKDAELAEKKAAKESDKAEKDAEKEEKTAKKELSKMEKLHNKEQKEVSAAPSSFCSLLRALHSPRPRTRLTHAPLAASPAAATVRRPQKERKEKAEQAALAKVEKDAKKEEKAAAKAAKDAHPCVAPIESKSRARAPPFSPSCHAALPQQPPSQGGCRLSSPR